MAVWNGTSGNNTINWSTQPLNPGETGHAMYGLGGNDTMVGHATIRTTLEGGIGNDRLTGQAGDDVLIGDDAPGITGGNDSMYGGGGTDLLFGGAGDDQLSGQGGNGDLLYGGRGSDLYRVNLWTDGMDVINDDYSAAASPGFGGGTLDYLFVQNRVLADLVYSKVGDDLRVSDLADINDGTASEYVTIEDFFLGGNNVIERISGTDFVVNTSGLLASPPPDDTWFTFI